MMPILFELGPLKIYSYGFFLAMSFAITISWLSFDMGRHMASSIGASAKETVQQTLDLFTLVIPCSILGGRLFYVIENPKDFVGNWLGAFAIWDGGLVYYGGLFGAVVCAYVWMRIHRWPMALFYDLAAPFILLGHAIGRIGCWFSGCCYGIVCDPAYGSVFPNTDGHPHYPTQIWEMIGDLILFVILLGVRGRLMKTRPWATFALYGLTYGLLRFVIEFWRREPTAPRLLVLFNSPSQLVSAVMMAISLVVLIRVFVTAKKPT